MLLLTPALALAPTPALTPTLTLIRYVDNLFEFSQSLGYDYSGAWLDDSTFRVEVLDAGPRVPVNRLTQARPAGGVYNPARTTQVACNHRP